MADISFAPEWRIIQDFPDYEASSLGEIRTILPYRKRTGFLMPGSIVPQRIVSIPAARGGTLSRFYIYLLRRGSARKEYLIVSRLVCRAFHGDPPSERHEAAHNNGVSTDNRSDNLRWATATENQADRASHGTTNRGSLQGAAILNEETVLQIKSALASGRTVGSVAKELAIISFTHHAI